MDSLRMVTCALCTLIFYLCRRCDYGNRYCTKSCRAQGRVRVQRLAQQSYRKTTDGRMRNAVRQTRFRDKRKQSQLQIVTHLGPSDSKPPVELSLPLCPVASATILPQPAPERSHEESTLG